jgi:peptide/nickel transport system substrate-binding protein
MSQEQDQHLRAFLCGAMTRREFVGRMSAAGLSAAAISTALAKVARAETPKRGGKVTVGVETAQTADSLDPRRYFSTADLLRGFTVYDVLINRGQDLLPKPHLAVSWESNADATEWVFELRKGVQFHSGKDFTADDVIYSITRLYAEDSESPAKSYLSQISEITKDGPHTVRLRLSSPNADLPIVMGENRIHMVEDGYQDFRTTTSGTGPFKVKEFQAGSTYVFERNDNYWGDGGPYIDEIEYVGIGDSTARVNALLSGDIDVLLFLDPKAVSLVNSRDDVAIIDAKSGSHRNVAMLRDRAPTNDNNFRLAMKYAIDRETIVKNVFKGYGHIGNDHQVSPIDPYYCDEIPQRVYDPDKANYYIKKAGLENKPIDFYTSDVPGSGGIAASEVFQQSAAAAGVQLNLIRPPADTYWQAIWLQKPVCVSGWDARPTPDLILSVACKSDSSYNETAWHDERFDKILVEARGVTDFAKRKEMYCELQRMLQDDGGVIILAFTDYLDARRSNVRGITPHPSGPLGFYQFATNLWLDT